MSMNAVATVSGEEKVTKIEAEQMLPFIALEYGYHMYIVKTTKELDCVIRISSVVSVTMIQNILRSFGENNKEALYGLCFRASGTTLAKGIIRRKREFLKAEKDAEKQLNDQLKQFIIQDRLGGMAKAIWQLCLLGGVIGFMYLLIKTVLNLPQVEVHMTNEQHFNFALAIAIASGLAVPIIRGFFTRRALLKIYTTYKEAMRVAKMEYHLRMGDEYKLALHTAEAGWEQLTGRKLPISQSAALQSLVNVMGISNDESRVLDSVRLEDLASSASSIVAS